MSLKIDITAVDDNDKCPLFLIKILLTTDYKSKCLGWYSVNVGFQKTPFLMGAIDSLNNNNLPF